MFSVILMKHGCNAGDPLLEKLRKIGRPQYSFSPCFWEDSVPLISVLIPLHMGADWRVGLGRVINTPSVGL